MKKTFRIFHSDLKTVYTNIIALIVVIGIAILPALYSWFNIASNWDPYSSTGNVPFAVCNLDKGFSYQGIEVNAGNEIVAALKGNPKMGWDFVDEAAAKREIETSLARSGAGYFDYYLLHDMGSGSYKIFTDLDCFNWLKEKKDQGLIKHMGFSCHDNAEFLDKALTEHPEMEFVQLQINYLDWDSEAIQSRKCYEVATKHGKPVIVMEPVKGGTLAKVPESVEQLFKSYKPDMSIPSWAIRFAASLDNVMMVLSGMSNMEQMLDNTSYMKEFEPLTEEDKKVIKTAVELINSNIAIPCTGCSYCTDGCPMKIAIPKYFSLYNADKQEVKEKGWTPQGEYYERLTHTFGKASACVGCGQCERACPQHLPIIEDLKLVAGYFE